jgi:hypothetical protein
MVAALRSDGTTTTIGVTRLDIDSTTATLVSHAATITKYAAIITTEALTTAHTATQAFVITKVGVAAGDLAFVSLNGGTNTGGIPIIKSVVCTTDTVTVTLWNAAKATDALNGTLIFNLLIAKVATY